MKESEPIRLTRAQVREVDRLAVEKYHVPGIVLMENAARAVTDAAWDMIGDQTGVVVEIVCGAGNNGGDGFAVARHLHNRGVRVRLSLGAIGNKTPHGDAGVNYAIIEAMKLIDAPDNATPPTLIIDALFGTGLDRAPSGAAEQAIDSINRSGARVLAIDLPSGLDCDTGTPLGACVRAHRTITFVAQKSGFANPRSKEFTGEVLVGDIGCPRELIEEVARNLR